MKLRRLARAASAHRRLIFLVTGGLMVVIGLMLRSSVAFVCGMLVAGAFVSDGEVHTPTFAMVRTWAWLHKGRTDELF